jgi:hypothetical protein
MARVARGGAFAARGRVFMRVTIAAGQRRAEALPWVTAAQWAEHAAGDACVCVACVRARQVQAWITAIRGAGKADDFAENVIRVSATADGAKMRELAKAVDGIVGGQIVPAKPKGAVDGPVTFEAFAMRWVRGELAADFPDYVERKRSAYVDLCNLRKYVFPVVGDKPIAAVTLEDFKQIMREVDGRAKRKLARATRRQVAQVTRRVMGLAQFPAELIPSNPIPANAMPPKRSETVLQFVYPDEDALLLADTRAELGHRLLYGFMHRQGPRRSEALGGAAELVDDAVDDYEVFGDVPALTWGRIDLRRGAILPDRNKTGDMTLTPLEPDLVRALEAWKRITLKSGPDDPVFVTTDGAAIEPREATESYRAMLRAALVAHDCDRPELWTAGHGRRVLRLHDARASFVTVALVNGRSEDWVRRRSKHKSSAIERYRRVLGTFRELELGDWVPLDVAIPEIATVVAESAAAKTAADAAASIPIRTPPLTLTRTRVPTKPKSSERLLASRNQSGRKDSNLRPLDPQSSALTRLRYAPASPTRER